MAFIDIFNFKKYINKPIDSSIARIGHINALKSSVEGRITKDFVTQTSSLVTPVTINSIAGTITTATPIGFIPTNGFVVNNSEVKSTSVVILTIETTVVDEMKEVLIDCNDITDGSFRINTQVAGSTPGTQTANPITIHFLVINP